LVGSASHPTTVGTDVLDGLDAAIRAAGGAGHPLLVCSSAGGGLRLAVVGYERLVTARAAQQVGLTAGARVVHVAAGRLDGAGIAGLRAARPDVVLLVGGTDGGDADVLTHNGRRLATARLRVPVVLAGNADARDAVVAALTGDGTRPAVAGTLGRSRTVEGDLGMRWSATGVVEAAVAERLLPAAGALAAVGDGLAAADDLAAAAAARVADPGLVALDDAEGRIATLAATLALRRRGRAPALRGGRVVSG